jgi:hypothetical protein
MTANPPQLVSLQVNSVSSTATHADLQATLVFDQPMNTSSTPEIVITPSAFAANVSIAQGIWVSPTIYEATLTVIDTVNYAASFEVHVAQAEPESLALFGECPVDTLNMAQGTNCLPLSIYITAPTCLASAEGDLFTDANIDSNYTIHVEFSESMDTTTFDFSTIFENTDFSNNFFWNSTNWLAENALELNFTFVDNQNNIIIPLYEVLQGTDLAGLATEGCAISEVIEVDTENPSVALTALTPTNIISDPIIENNTYFTITFNFTNEMDTEVFPYIAFENDDPTVQTITLDSTQSYWISAFGFLAVFTLTDNNVELNNIVVTLSGVTDINMNPLSADGYFVQPFSVDTRNPIITDLQLSNQTLDNENCADGLTITVVYDEPMSSDTSPNIVLSEGMPPLAESGAGSWNAEFTAFTQNYTCTGINDSILAIAISITGNSADVAGNISADTTFENQLDINYTTNVSELIADDLLVYPNPVSGGQSFQIISPVDLIVSVTAYDAVGRVVFSTRPSATKTTVDTPQWSSGIYMLRIETTRNEFIKPILAID